MFTVVAYDKAEKSGRNKGLTGVLIYNSEDGVGRVHDVFYWSKALSTDQLEDFSKVLEFVYKAGMMNGRNEFKKHLKELLTPDEY